ncbi:hypothetical protein BGZ58_000583 [Dissophora ornata]|nr:hypothetical protein BGZ58_000583 [Dissophora ornata]
MSFPPSSSAAPMADYNANSGGTSLFQAAMTSLQQTQQQQQQEQILQKQVQLQQQTQQRRQRQPIHQRVPPPPPTQQVSTKALAITSFATEGMAPPPLMGSAIVLANNSALHCFGGRLENRDLTNCHYVLDVETGVWDTIQPAPAQDAPEVDPESATGIPDSLHSATSFDLSGHSSLSLTTDPADPAMDPDSVQPLPRYFHTLNAFGTSLILFGGMGKVPDNEDKDRDEQESVDGKDGESTTSSQGTLAALNDLWVFDIITQRWQQKHPTPNAHSPRPRWAHMATILDHYLVVIGGTDTVKVYVEDACVLDLRTWEWVASIQSIGQCGSYRTVAATGPSKQSSATVEPSAPSFPSAYASSPQTSSNLARPMGDSGPVDAMGSISIVLSGRISAPSSITSSSIKEEDTADTSFTNSYKHKHSGRLMSGELTPAFKSGRDVPSIYLYSNYNFHKLQRDFKVITPHYTHPTVVGADRNSSSLTPSPPPSFSLVEKSQALNMMGNELPPGLRFPQGHVYQNQLILTGTLIVPGKPPTLAIYAFNLAVYKWERLATDSILETGSWNRSLLHPATGTLIIFGNHKTDAEMDYANRIQHHDHLMMINLQAYGLYDRPVPSIPQAAQDLGQDLLINPSLSDMHVASTFGTLFGANSTMLAARWPEFATLLLSPPYVTPLILILPVPDEIVPLFLQYLYTGALPMTITAGMADYLLILARRYELNGLYALIMDILHQTVHLHPVRIYSTALIAGEMGLQARAVGLAMQKIPSKRSSTSKLLVGAPPVAASYLAGATDGKELPALPSSPVGAAGSGRVSALGTSHSYGGQATLSPAHMPFQMLRRANSSQSRDSLSTDGGYIAEGIMQQYSGGRLIPVAIREDPDEQNPYSSSPPTHSSLLRPLRSPTLITGAGVGSGSAAYTNSSLSSPGRSQSPNFYQNAYPSPLSPSFQQQSYGYDDYGQDERTTQAKKRLQFQLQQDDSQLPYHQQQLQFHSPQHTEYLMQQQLLLEQQRMREREVLLLEQARLQHLRYVQKQQKLRAQAAVPSPDVVGDALDYHFGVKSSGSSSSRMESTASRTSSTGPGKSSKEKDKKDKDKPSSGKGKSQKGPINGEELMKSAGF